MGDDQYLTVEDVARLLRVDEATIRRMCDREEFAGAFKVGRQWRIPAASVDDYVARQQSGRRG